jgi:hypothetical protein
MTSEPYIELKPPEATFLGRVQRPLSNRWFKGRKEKGEKKRKKSSTHNSNLEGRESSDTEVVGDRPRLRSGLLKSR